ncbi:MAG: MarR family transcriptional regulator [Pseudomonadota bacterium]
MKKADPSGPPGSMFELFNEIGIIHQLSTTAFNRTLPDGLHVSHFSVVNHLVRLGDGKTPLELARAFQVTKANMTNTVARLEERGLVATSPNPVDGRSKLVHLTGEGRAFRERAIGALQPMIERIETLIERDLVLSAIPALRHLREALDSDRDEH